MVQSDVDFSATIPFHLQSLYPTDDRSPKAMRRCSDQMEIDARTTRPVTKIAAPLKKYTRAPAKLIKSIFGQRVCTDDGRFAGKIKGRRARLRVDKALLGLYSENGKGWEREACSEQWDIKIKCG